MKIRTIVLACLATLLCACSALVPGDGGSGPRQWNGGVWNSVIGYHGPSNSMGDAGGPN